MRPLTYSRAADVDDALALVAADPASAFLAGGTNEVDLIRAGISHSQHLVDINELPLKADDAGAGHGPGLPFHPRVGVEDAGPRRTESEAVMTVLTKTQALGVIRRAYGPDTAESLAEHLPKQIDTEDPADHQLLSELGLTRERLFEALGAEW
jgi:hypothetical protein